MLTQIHIRHLATIVELCLELKNGTTVITGETGAGKSILMDAIELALGKRATTDIIREGEEKADISLCFDISQLTAVKAWLAQADLLHDSDECIIRRTISRDGRSKSYINQLPTTLQQLRELSELLIQIHGQHEHQTLISAEMQRDLIDHYGNHTELNQRVRTLAEKWQALTIDIATCKKSTAERNARTDFLNFQLRELDELGLRENEFQALDLEHKQLSHTDELLQQMNHSLICLSDNDKQDAISALHLAIQALTTIQRIEPKVTNWIASIEQARVLVKEVTNDIRHQLAQVEAEPERLQWLEQRMSQIFALARKHKIEPEQLVALQKTLADEQQLLATSDERILELERQLVILEQDYHKAATQLSTKRQQAAMRLAKEVTTCIRQLSLPHGEFHVALEAHHQPMAAYGLEKIIFQIKTNVGHSLQPLAKIASGGELSRIGLAIHIATAEQHTIPTLIFDEVDVGISGGTAEIVGKLLRRLGKTHQVVCITHLPQVAACGHQHLRVDKSHGESATHTQIYALSEKERITELARMLGGVNITKTTLQHAEEMTKTSMA